MKKLTLSLLAASFMLIQHAFSQSEGAFEGLRFNHFKAEASASVPPNIFGRSTLIFNCNTNEAGARIEVVLDKDRVETPEGSGNWVVTNLTLIGKGTNYWNVDPTNGAVGDLTSSPWVSLSNEVVVHSWNEGTYFQGAPAPFLGKGTLAMLGLTNVSAELDLVIAGNPDFTNDVVVTFTVSATDADTGQRIPDADITVAGESVTNGVAWKSFSEHSTNGVTVGVSGHANWTAELSASIFRLTMSGSGFLYLDADTNSTPTSTTNTNQFQAAAASSNPTNTGPLIYYTYEPDPVEFPTTNEVKTIIGRRMTFSVKPPMLQVGMTFTNFAWSIQGDTVTNFFWGEEVSVTNGQSVTQYVGRPIFDYPKTNLTVTFAWWRETNGAIVKFSAKLNGKPVSSQCRVKVRKPPAFIVESQTGDDGIMIGNVYFDDNGSLAKIKLGLKTESDVGVRFVIGGKQDYGEFGWIQLINSSERITYRDGSLLTFGDGTTTNLSNLTNSASGLDNGVFFPDQAPWTDSPGDAFLSGSYPGHLGASISDSFTTFLMFNPQGTGVLVPVQSVDWKWSAALTNSTTTNRWIRNTGTNWLNRPEILPVNRTPGFPTWNKRIVNGQ